MLQRNELRSIFLPKLKMFAKVYTIVLYMWCCFLQFLLPEVNRGSKILSFLNYQHCLLLISNSRHHHSSMIQDHLKQMMLPLTYCQKVSSSLTLGHNAYVIHLTLSYHIGILSSHSIKGKRRVSTVQ